MGKPIDWSVFDKWPEQTITCQCGETFRSHAKGVARYGGFKMVTRKPCPRCGCTGSVRRAASDPETVTFGG